MRRIGLIVLVALTGCFGRTAPAPRTSEAMERSARLLKMLDAMEADLHQGAAEMGTYAELVERHAQAEQIACKVTDQHVTDIERLSAIQEARMQRQSVTQLRRKAVAMARRRPSRRAMASN